jgi:hypothetical protein
MERIKTRTFNTTIPMVKKGSLLTSILLWPIGRRKNMVGVHGFKGSGFKVENA